MEEKKKNVKRKTIGGNRSERAGENKPPITYDLDDISKKSPEEL